MKHLLLLSVIPGLALLSFAAQAETNDEVSVQEQRRCYLQRAVDVKPHPRQVAWQSLEFSCFVHFGVNTFSDREWGTGKEDPQIFNPSQLDARQWARTARAAGMKLMILTAKHHDGFCLWPSRYAEHSVASSPFRAGKGDVLREFVDACHEFGLKVGVYLSPADLYQIESPNGYYGNHSSKQPARIPTQDHISQNITFDVVADDYNRYFMNQLYELLTQYGPIHEVWFDGANPKPGTGQTYDYLSWYRIIRKLQPDAVIFGKGPDVRWVGNEGGHTRDSEWSVIPIETSPDQFTGGDQQAEDLGSREKIRDAKHLIWYPAETDVSIRPGWFYHASQDSQVRSVENLLDIWYHAVGGNAVLLLNVPPDRRGLFHETDVARLTNMGEILKETFRSNLAAAAKVVEKAAQPHLESHPPSCILDDDTGSCWKLPDGTTAGDLMIELDEPVEFDRVVLQEPIGRYGQRVERFKVDVWQSGEWQQISEATVIGYKRILRFAPVTTDRVRVRFVASRISPALATFGLYRSPGSAP